MTGAGGARRETWEERWLLPADLLADGRADDGPRRPAPRTGRDWVVDALFFAGALSVWAAAGASPGQREFLPDWLVAADSALGGLACLALWWRRRFPLALGLAMVPVGMVSASALGALTVALLNLGLRAPRRQALLVLGLNVAAALPYLLISTLPAEGSWVVVTFLLGFYLFFFAWGFAVRARRQLVARLRQDAERQRADHARRLADARRAEREAIAREMHDVLAHRISLLSVHASALAYRTADGSPAPPLPAAEISASAHLIRDTAHQALEELRQVLTVLRAKHGDAVAALPRLSDLKGLMAEAEEAGQRVALTEEYDTDALTSLREQVQRAAYRVVQEGLTNARKHAPGAEVTVIVRGGPGDGLSVLVRNALPPAFGEPAAEIPGGGAGLAGLEERVALDGGDLRHGRTADGAFELAASLPWPAA